MRERTSWLLEAVLLGLGIVTAGLLLERLAPPPSADVSRGSEEAFVEGLQERERSPARTPFRWTRERATAHFRRLPAGPATVEVEAVAHRGPVRVEVGGAVLGILAPSTRSGRYQTTVRRGGELDVALVAETFDAGGRRLGTQWRHVRVVTPRRARIPDWGLLLLLGLPTLLAWAMARLVGLPRAVSLASGLVVVAVGSVLLAPSGLLHAPYAWTLSLWLCAASGVAAVATRLLRSRGGGEARVWIFAAASCAVVVQGALATSPVMVTSDAVFQAHNLDKFMAGEIFLTSRTQHAQPFYFPYGIALFAAVAPLRAAGLDAVTLVRWGAGLAGIAASLAMLLGLSMLPMRRRALAVLLLQFLPGTFLIYSQGNLPNAFGQAATTLLFVWWVGRTRGGWPIGAVLLAVAALGHFSCAIVLVPLCAGLWLAWRGQPRPERRVRAWALLAGAAAALLYYAHFAPLMLKQVGRLLEGGGQGAADSLVGVLRRQIHGALFDWWGIPVVVLLVLTLPQKREAHLVQLRLGLKAYWVSVGVFFLMALVSPLEVRYLYALTIPVALTAASRVEGLESRGMGGAILAWLLVAAQLAQGVAFVVERLLSSYREVA